MPLSVVDVVILFRCQSALSLPIVIIKSAYIRQPTRVMRPLSLLFASLHASFVIVTIVPGELNIVFKGVQWIQTRYIWAERVEPNLEILGLCELQNKL